MAVSNSFDQWQKDVFFSAAEAVQESADIMESLYRMWIRDRSDGFKSNDSDELRGVLHTALGTAKWQLEEFEKAVNLSHENRSSGENTISRHRQFVIAIKNQISHVEKALSDSLSEEGKQPLRWVQLNEEERDDLAVFLSAAPQTLQEMKDKCADHDIRLPQVRTMPDSVSGFKEPVTINNDAKYIMEVAAKEPPKSKNEVLTQGEQLNGQRRTCNSLDTGAWKIVIADGEDMERRPSETRPETSNRASNLCGLLRSIGSTARSKWFRNSFGKEKSGEHLRLRQGLSSYLDFKGFSRFSQRVSVLNERSRSCFTSCTEDSKASNFQQLVGRVGSVQSHVHGSQYYMQFGRSLRITLLLVLTIFLIVPFILYST